MSEFHVQVAKITNIQKHPNADTLSTATLNGYPVIIRTGDFQEGDLAVHIPIDSICPKKEPFLFLEDNLRIKAKKLRGIFSMGLAIPLQGKWKEGQNVQKELGITKYEPKPESGPKRQRKPLTRWQKIIRRIAWFFGIRVGKTRNCDPGFLPSYTDIEGYRKYPHILQEGEEVCISEKLHGSTGSYVSDGKKLWLRSSGAFRHPDDDDNWAAVGKKFDLANKFKKYPMFIFHGEIYGDVQDLKYDTKPGELKFALFGIQDAKTFQYKDWDDFVAIAKDLELEIVPLLYRGPWKLELCALAEGKTTLGGKHVREGFVVIPVKERYVEHFGRCILKYVGQGYLLRKGA